MTAMHGPIDDDALRGYLAETLSPEASARVEKALRESSELRARLEDVRKNRNESGLHTLGAIWRRGRLTCSSRQTWGGYLLDTLDPEHAEYLRFHLEVIGCPFCHANLADLRAKSEASAPSSKNRQKRIYSSSRHLLGGEGG
jgi:hypothetical protein